MNVRLVYDMVFTAGIWYDAKFHMNNYILKLNLITNTKDSQEQNIALARMKHFIYEIIQHSVFINETDLDQRKKFAAAGIQVTSLPEEPVDQIVGMAVFAKLNAVMEERLIITEASLSSELGDSVVYRHSNQEQLGPLERQGWWHDTDPTQSDKKSVNRNQTVIAINRGPTWRDIDLDWTESVTKESDIVMASFKREKE